MAISLASIRRGSALTPPAMMVYAVHGIGKTSLAAYAPEPIFLRTEDGLGLLDVPTFDMLRSYDDFTTAIGELYNGEHNFKTLVLDTADWLEPLIYAEVCSKHGWQSIETPGYGRGYVEAINTWREVLDGLNALRNDRGMAVVVLAHSEVKKHSAPDIEAFDRYRPKLQERASALLQEHMDAVLFVNYQVSLKKDNPQDKNSRVRGVGGGTRMLYTQERPAYLAKNRWRMPPQIILPDEPEQMWGAVAQHIPYFARANAA